MSKKLFATCISMVTAISVLSSPVSASNGMNDVPAQHWAYNTLENWIDDGLLQGDEQGNLSPNDPITRAQFAALINRLLKLEAEANIHYSDVSPNAWYASDISKAHAAGYLGGYEDGAIRPLKAVSRAEAAAILTKLLDLAPNMKNIEGFTDSIPDWSKYSISSVVEAQYMVGYPDNTFQPNKALTRAEAVALLDRVREDAVEALPEPEPPEEEVALIPSIINQSGVYGSPSKVSKVKGDIVIQTANVTLQNVEIDGDIVISPKAGQGTIYIDSSNIKGKASVNGGRISGIYFKNTAVKEVNVNNTGTIFFHGTSTVESYTQKASGEIYISKNAQVNLMTLEGKTLVSGANRIIELIVKHSEVTLDTSPFELEVESGIDYPTITDEE